MLDRFLTEEACTTYILYNKDNGGIVVDPGYNVNNCLIKHIQKINVNVVGVLLTHGHFDHIAALEDIFNAYPNASLYVSEDEIGVIENPKYNLSAFNKGWFNHQLTFVPEKTIKLMDYELFDAAGYEIEMIKTPFHTKGSCCFYVKEENILFSGDTLFSLSIGRSDLPTGSERTIDSSLRKLINLPAETKIYPGHGPSTSLDRELKHNSYLKNLL